MKLPIEYDGIPLTRNILNKILTFAWPPSFNANNAIGYSFSLYMTKQNKIEWDGGWEFNINGIEEDFFIDFKTLRVYYTETGKSIAKITLKKGKD